MSVQLRGIHQDDVLLVKLSGLFIDAVEYDKSGDCQRTWIKLLIDAGKSEGVESVIDELPH